MIGLRPEDFALNVYLFYPKTSPVTFAARSVFTTARSNVRTNKYRDKPLSAFKLLTRGRNTGKTVESSRCP